MFDKRIRHELDVITSSVVTLIEHLDPVLDELLFSCLLLRVFNIYLKVSFFVPSSLLGQVIYIYLIWVVLILWSVNQALASQHT